MRATTGDLELVRCCCRQLHRKEIADARYQQPPHSTVDSLPAERIAKLWGSPAVSWATKAAEANTAKSLAKLNEMLARLNAKK